MYACLRSERRVVVLESKEGIAPRLQRWFSDVLLNAHEYVATGGCSFLYHPLLRNSSVADFALSKHAIWI